MKKVLEIFKNDLSTLYKNKIALVLIIGLIIIPGIYAWLNIDSNWSPYTNTGNIPIAVVNEDNGVKFLNDNINMGNEIEKALKSNDAMDWKFTTKKDALSKVKKGKYYGAIIIPKNFSNNLTTIIETTDPKKPTFDFYVNNKKNPVAPIIVNKAVSTIQNSVNESFVNEVVYKTVDTAETLDIVGKTSLTSEHLIDRLEESKSDIQMIKATLKTADSAANVTSKSLMALRQILPTINDLTNTTDEGINDMKNAVKSFEDTYAQIENEITTTITDIEKVIQDIQDTTNSTNTSNASDKYKELSTKLDNLEVKLKRLDNVLASVNSVANLQAINDLRNKISNEITKIDKIQSLLKDTSHINNNLDDIKKLIKDLNADILTIKDIFNNKIKNDLSKLYKNASASVGKAATVLQNVNVSLGSVDMSMQYMIEALNSAGELNSNLDTLIDGTIEDIDRMIAAVKLAKQSEIFNNIANILKNKPEVIADYISSPIDTNQIDVYPIKSYGSEMAPFYSILACWVGCTILLAILKIEMKESKITKNATKYEKLFGRFMLFGLLAMLQGLVIGIGDIVLDVQTVNWFLFLITLMLSSLIFSLIIFSLAVAFGKVGQALSIIIMVLQVAGSGGTFPIELLPRFFQIVQPFMPFYPAMNALRETIGGFYHYNYLLYVLLLLTHIITPLILILVFSKYTADLKEKIGNQLEKTDIIS